MKKEFRVSYLSVFTMAALISGVAFPLIVAAQGRSDEVLAALGQAQHVPDEVLVQFHAGVSRAQKAATRRRTGAERLETVLRAHAAPTVEHR